MATLTPIEIIAARFGGRPETPAERIAATQVCEACDGFGVVPDHDDDKRRWAPCDECRGEGRVRR